MRVLCVNAGSSSLKLTVLGDTDEVVFASDLDADRGVFSEHELGRAVGSFGASYDAIGHRIVHGGAEFTGPVVLTDGVEASLRRLSALAPLHQAASLAAVDAVRRVAADVPAVACFDTAFHATLPPEASTYAVPAAWRARLGVRRFGFHGLSNAYVSRRAPEILQRPREALRLVSCHLGSGASVTAILGGRSVDTTMGFTPLEGLVMATRSGSVDPGLVLWLARQPGLGLDEVSTALESESGLVALAGTPDMAEVVQRGDRGDAHADLALSVYTHRVCASVAAMAAAMDGVDALVFTGGVGEHAPQVRARAVSGLGFLGFRLDEERNRSLEGDADVAAAGSNPVLVVRAREDLEIAAEVRRVVS